MRYGIKYGGIAILTLIIMSILVIVNPLLVNAEADMKGGDVVYYKAVSPHVSNERILKNILKAYVLLLRRLLIMINNNAFSIKDNETLAMLKSIASLTPSQIMRMSYSDVKGNITLAREVLRKIISMNITITNTTLIERRMIRRIVDVAHKLAFSLGLKNSTLLAYKLKKILTISGKVKGIGKLFRILREKFREESSLKASLILMKIINQRLKEISKSPYINESIKGLRKALERINKTKRLLINVLNNLEKSNASLKAVEAIRAALNNLNIATNILSSVSMLIQEFKSRGVGALIQLTRNVTKLNLLEQINMTERELSGLKYRIVNLIDLLTNVSKGRYGLEGLKERLKSMLSLTNKLENDLNYVKELTRRGNLTKAITKLVYIRSKIYVVEKQLIGIEIRVVSLKQVIPLIKENLRKHLSRVIKDAEALKKDVKDLKKLLMNVSSTSPIKALLNILIKKLNTTYAMINEVRKLLNSNESVKALTLLRRIDLNICMIKLELHRLKEMVKMSLRLKHPYPPRRHAYRGLITIIKRINVTLIKLINEEKSIRERALAQNNTKAINFCNKAREILNNVSLMLANISKRLKSENMSLQELTQILKSIKEDLVKANHYIHLAKEALATKHRGRKG